MLDVYVDGLRGGAHPRCFAALLLALALPALPGTGLAAGFFILCVVDAVMDAMLLLLFLADVVAFPGVVAYGYNRKCNVGRGAMEEEEQEVVLLWISVFGSQPLST